MKEKGNNVWLIWLVIMWLMIISMRLGQIADQNNKEARAEQVDISGTIESIGSTVETAIEVSPWIMPVLLFFILFPIMLVSLTKILGSTQR